MSDKYSKKCIICATEGTYSVTKPKVNVQEGTSNKTRNILSKTYGRVVVKGMVHKTDYTSSVAKRTACVTECPAIEMEGTFILVVRSLCLPDSYVYYNEEYR